MSQPSASRHHADWLSLVEVSGPFVSLPVLMRVFPQGLEPRDPAQAKALRAAYEEWEDNPTAPGSQRAWVMHVLTAVLGYTPEQIAEGQTLPAGLEAKMPEMGETLRPDFALTGIVGSDTAGQAQLIIASYSAEQALDKPVIGRHWKATPATRMMELLHGTGVPLGLVTNGEQWMLVYAPRGETTGYATWYGALWLDEPITLRAFHSLLGVRRFFGVATDSTLLAMLRESASDQQEVTDQLGYQVREAVEVLVKSVDTLDRENHRALLKDLPETVLYDAALTIMMRLVFLFAAEERGLLHLGKPLYDDNYAVSTLQEQLQETADQHGEEVLERRFDAWTRLLASFRAVHGGIQHQDLLMIAYGGSLFDPDRYPFIEGRAPQSSWKTSAAEALAVNNRVVLHLLNSLQRLHVRVPGGGPAESRRISFRALGVEQIGHVYEGLLDRTAVRATEPVLGIKGARHKERDVSLATLESLFIQGRDKLLEFLKEETGRSLSGLEHALDEVSLLDEHRLLMACGHDKKLLERVRPFANLIRIDSFVRPQVTLAGSIYVTTATIRRSTGTHYTPPSLTEPIVQHTLEPLVYEGPAEGLPREQWRLIAPKAILDLKVCDMAMGSGAFLVQACRYMADRLVESWEILEKQHTGEVLITPEGAFSAGSPSERLVPADLDERIAIARRVIADRCLFGVDINPMAVEMAKLSLWLVTLQRDRPFSFLDHALKCGDSLLGVSSLKQIESFSLRTGERQFTFATANLFRSVEEASAKRLTLGGMPSNDCTEIEAKNRLHAEAEAATAKIKALADTLIAFELRGLSGKLYEQERADKAEKVQRLMRLDADPTTGGQPSAIERLSAFANKELGGRRTFHWPVEFPEVFDHGGFDAFVGNPPFIGGQKITGTVGVDYRNYLVSSVAQGKRGNADLCAYFCLRMWSLMRTDGFFGLVATNTIAEGDTLEIALAQILKWSGTIFRADPNVPWPGSANLEVSIVWVRRGKWTGTTLLKDERVAAISPRLVNGAFGFGTPSRLRANTKRSFKGSDVLGIGFAIGEDEAKSLTSKAAKNGEALFQFLNGDDVNSRPDQSPSRFIVNFHEWPLERGAAGKSYHGPVAADFPDLLAIVEERVKPDRQKRKPDGSFSLRSPLPQKWWVYNCPREELYATIEPLRFVIVGVCHTKYWTVSLYPTKIVFSHALVIFASDSMGDFGLLHSSVHEIWARAYSGSLETRLRYSPSDCFDTFPFPIETSHIGAVAERYHSCRRELMRKRQEGITNLYNRFHNPAELSKDIARLRELHAEMDRAVAAAYGWNELDFEHGFHETKQGVRYTTSEQARRVVLDRLLALNHQRHAEEEAENVANAASAPVKRGRKKRDKADRLTLDLL
jgi:hypothetical protein